MRLEPGYIRLVCVDVDGTLVGSSGGVHAAVWRAADRLRSRGVHLAVCSGRPGLGIAIDLARRIDADGWHCFQNGASILHLGSGASRSAQLPPETVRGLIAQARAKGRTLELYSDDEYVIENSGARAEQHAALLGVPFSPRRFETLMAPIVRAQWMVPFSETASVLAEPYPDLEVSPSTSPVMPDTQFISLTRAGIDKAFALRSITDSYGISLEQTMFVGDSANDISAMSIAGVPVAMANAETHVAAIASIAVGHVDDGGLAEALHIAMGAKPGRTKGTPPGGTSPSCPP